MKYRRMGRTGMRVSEICLGALTFGNQVDDAGARAIVGACLDNGVNFFDTANSYTDGRSEEILGRVIEGHRDDVVIATKVCTRVGPGPNDGGLSRVHIMRAVEDSLRRLRTDRIDLYQQHQPDFQTPLDETLRALDDLVRQGKVLYVGSSNYPAWYLAKALWTGDSAGMARVDCEQPRYNLLDRSAEAELFPLCLAEGVGVIVYNPLAGGLLTGKYRRDEPPPPDTRFAVSGALYMPRYWYEQNLDAVERLVAIAGEAGASPGRIAIAWALRHRAVTSAIVGATSAAQVIENVSAVEVPVTEDLLDALDEVRGVAY